MIDEYFEKGIMGSNIGEKIREIGYDGSSSKMICKEYGVLKRYIV